MAEGHASSCSSWVVEMEKMLPDADRSAEMARWNRPSIYRVPEYIKDITNRKAYQPVLVSLGPYHHREPNLLPMEEHKRRAVLHRVKKAGKPLSEFVNAVVEVVDELQSAYDELDGKWLGEDRRKFVEMMVMDGCFLLEIFRTGQAAVQPDGFVLDDYAPNDPVFSETALLSLWPHIRTDMVLMENQLPLLVLQRLIAVEDGATPTARSINALVSALVLRPWLVEENGVDEKLGLHPLDILHKSLGCPCNQRSTLPDDYEETTHTAVALSDAGIHFMKSTTDSVGDIDFKSGVLSMPLIGVDDDSEKKYLNLMAFERLHSGAGKDVTSYISFMDTIIDTGADVALLRARGLINNCLSSDEDAAVLFNTLGKGIGMNPYSKLNDVDLKLDAHCKKRLNRWRASFTQTYLKTPWVFISLMAATILLIATIIQTVYTVISFYK